MGIDRKMRCGRRRFLREVSLGAAKLAAIPGLLAAAMPPAAKESSGLLASLPPESVILFQGDSLTDAGRERERQASNSAASFGGGYALMAAAHVLCEHADSRFRIFNRGNAGNKVFQLAGRWRRDCLELKPAVVSVLIGVNDFWHKLTGRYDGTVAKYEDDYRQLLTLTRDSLPGVRFVIGEPFAVTGSTVVDEKWFPEFDEYRSVARKLATEFGAVFIPYQEIFSRAQAIAPVSYWTVDGVHPSMAGASLMAQAWVRAVM